MTSVTASPAPSLPAWVSANREVGNKGDEVGVGPDPWDDVTEAVTIEYLTEEDFAPWEDLSDPLDPHGKCSGLNCWWDLTGRQRCAECDPPNKARLLRSTVATQRRRAERRRLAAEQHQGNHEAAR